jgi:hypothetical protein
MVGHEIAIAGGDELVRLVRALGQHRYVAGRMHLVHAFALDAARGDPALEEATRWADGVLGDPSIDAASRDERLVRRASDAELVATLAAFFAAGEGDGEGERRQAARARLRERLHAAGLDSAEGGRVPLDEAAEDDVFPLLVDAGWELLPLAALDPARHRGAIDAFGDALAWDIARFEEEGAVPPRSYLHELPALGPVELLADDAALSPFVLWCEGPRDETYLDYVLRGVLRAAKLQRFD